MGELLFPQSKASGLPAELELPRGQLTLVGTSVAAQATAFALPKLGVAVDIGRLTPTLAQQPTLLLTHAHLDHSAGLLAYLNFRARFYQDQPTTVCVPAPIQKDLLEALRLFPGMASVAKRLPLAEVIRPVEDGQEIIVEAFRVRAFAVKHSVPTLGYSLSKFGQDSPEVVFASDGDPRFFSSRPHLLQGQMAVVECSFLGENRRVAARMAEHAHILDWLELAPLLPVEVLILSHLPKTLPSLDDFKALAQRFPGEVVVWAESSHFPEKH